MQNYNGMRPYASIYSLIIQIVIQRYITLYNHFGTAHKRLH